MKYIDIIKQSMDFLGTDNKTIFIGYNVKFGSMGNKTLTDINKNQLIETPVAENLMMGLCIGMALEGYKPIIYFERFDFILNALDSIVNHLDKFKNISNNEYNPKVIIRVVQGNKINPLYTGDTHTQDFTEALKNLVSFNVVKLTDKNKILETYKNAYYSNMSSVIIEEKDLYNT